MRKLMVVAVLSLLLPLSPAWPKSKKAPPAEAAPPAKSETAPAKAAADEAPPAPIFVKVDGKKVEIPTGTKIRLEVQERIVAHKKSVGQEIPYLVLDDVTVPGGTVVIKKGATATGYVVARGGIGGNFSLVRKAGKVTFNAESATAVDGTQVPLIFTQTSKGQGGLGMTLLFGGGKGKNAKIKQGAIIEAVIGHAPVVVKEETSVKKGDEKRVKASK